MKTYKTGDKYYYLTEFLEVRMCKWNGAQKNYDRQKVFNCFEMRSGAEEARYHIINELRQYND